MMMITVTVFILFRLLAVISLLSTIAGVIYYVKPTKPCVHDSSCPSNETCHTMDHYASKSSQYFSPDHINVTLYFMCGVHNCTQQMNISDLQTFAIIGTAGREYVMINMPIPREGSYPYFYLLTNISTATMKNIAIIHISVHFNGIKPDHEFNVINANVYGYINFASNDISAIYITGASALFKNCTFQQNSFLRPQASRVIIHDCIFHSYNHLMETPIAGQHNTLNLSGSVYIFNNSIGSPTHRYAICCGAIFIKRSVLNINDGAYVHFINNTADCGGAICLSRAAMNVANNANVYFFENKIRKLRHVEHYTYKFGGAAVLLVYNSYIKTGASTKLHFYRNFAGYFGGAILMHYQSEIWLNSNTLVNFTSNVAAGTGGAITVMHSSIHIASHTVVHFQNNKAVIYFGGGAVYLIDQSILNITANASVYFYNNTAINKEGGALSVYSSYLFIQNSTVFIENNSASKYAGGGIFMSDSNLKISKSSKVFFSANLALLQGGAIYLSSGDNISIDSFSKLIITNNSANQGGALYLTASATMHVGNDSAVKLAYNTALDRGGAVYANVQLNLPCFLALTSFSSTIIFERNVAKGEVGMDVYGASIRSSACAAHSRKIHTLSYCGNKANKLHTWRS